METSGLQEITATLLTAIPVTTSGWLGTLGHSLTLSSRESPISASPPSVGKLNLDVPELISSSSSGVHLAILGGLTAALTIAAPLRGHCSETVASDFYNIKSGTAYTR